MQHAPLFRLPPELIDQIFYQVVVSSGTYDARLLLLALTCKTLLACARRRIVRRQTQHHAPLAGHRLICIGEGATALRDYPSGLLTAAEAEKLRTSAGDSGREDQASLYAHATAHWSRYSFRRPYSSSSLGCGIGMAGLADLIYRPSAVTRMSMEDYVRFQALTTASHFDQAAESQRQPQVLCNLSKQEYACVERSDSSQVTLWHVLLACVCWTGPADGDDEQLYRGPWAGDRIAIRTLDLVEWAANGEMWKDVTREAMSLVNSIQIHCGVGTTLQ